LRARLDVWNQSEPDITARPGNVGKWPVAPLDEHRMDGRHRGIAAVGSVKLNGSKGSI
jgi:hypothetical protein